MQCLPSPERCVKRARGPRRNGRCSGQAVPHSHEPGTTGTWGTPAVTRSLDCPPRSLSPCPDNEEAIPSQTCGPRTEGHPSASQLSSESCWSWPLPCNLVDSRDIPTWTVARRGPRISTRATTAAGSPRSSASRLRVQAQSTRHVSLTRMSQLALSGCLPTALRPDLVICIPFTEVFQRASTAPLMARFRLYRIVPPQAEHRT